MKRPVTVGAWDFNSGNVISLPLHKMTFEDENMQLQGILGSMNLPNMAPPLESFEGYALADGGTFAAINMQDAINDCRELGFADKDIYLDLSVCGYSVSDHKDVRKLERQPQFNLWNIHKQVEDVQSYYLT